MGVPVFVVTHEVPDGWPRDDAPFTFVTDGVESALEQAKAVAGDGIVGVGGADITQQCLNAGLLDEIRVNLVPVLLDKGVRYLDNLADVPVRLEGSRVVEGTGVTHLYYRVTSGRVDGDGGQGDDSIALLSRALDQVGAVIGRVRPEQATMPTPAVPGTCGRWSIMWWTRCTSSPR